MLARRPIAPWPGIRPPAHTCWYRRPRSSSGPGGAAGREDRLSAPGDRNRPVRSGAPRPGLAGGRVRRAGRSAAGRLRRRLNRGKNVMALAEAVRARLDAGDDLHLLCGGEGEDKAAIEALLGDRCTCPGAVPADTLARFDACGDIFAFRPRSNRTPTCRWRRNPPVCRPWSPTRRLGAGGDRRRDRPGGERLRRSQLGLRPGRIDQRCGKAQSLCWRGPRACPERFPVVGRCIGRGSDARLGTGGEGRTGAPMSGQRISIGLRIRTTRW